MESAEPSPADGLPEQITDRAIASAEEDLLGHEDFVARLLTIVHRTETPANIALFGRWGSGKSGIANRLQAEVKGRPEFKGFSFALFDAFKFARLPLLRRFLLQIAQSLGGSERAEGYQRRLYERVERVRLRRSFEELRGPLVDWTAAALLVLAGLIWLFDLVAWLLTAEQLRVLLHIMRLTLPILLPAGLLVALGAFAARHLTASTTTETPSSEEQFESLFRELLDEYGIGPEPGQRKLVVFVDELDRCSSVEVARTLESLKTFLGHRGCIFVVAADQSVLEHALTRRVRQATPRDLSNPYYSAGSAYLDKIFQYQINLPPLYPGRLTDFALNLLTKVGGVWDEVESKDDVVSVLLPVHVRSPRRVKVLLNAFAQAFALALARAESGGLDKDVKKRAMEVAKLVGLQVEFPLFAADLPLHRDLPELVLECAESEKPEELAALQRLGRTTRARVLGYSRGELPTDMSLDGPDGDGGMTGAQGTDLIDYLRHTEQVEGPRTDLVHLEGPSQTTGIDQALVIEIDNLALANSPVQLREVLEALEPVERGRGLGRLRELVRESKGNDADNAIRALLICWPLTDPRADLPRDLLAAVVRHQRRVGLQEDEMPSALDLAIKGREHSLQQAIVHDPKAVSEPLRSNVLGHADALIRRHAGRLGEVLADEIADSPRQAVERLTA